MSVRLRKWTDEEGTAREAWVVDVDFVLPTGERKRVRKTSPVNTRRGAEAYERELRHSLLAGTFGKERAQVPTVEEFAERFLTYSDNNNKPSTVDSKRAALRHHVLPYFGKKRLDEIGLADVEDFKAHLRRKTSLANVPRSDASKYAVKKRYGTGPKKLSAKSINNVLAVLRRLMSLAYEQGVIPHMPRVKLLRAEKTPFDFLDFDEADRLLQATEPEWRTLVLVALKTGLRRGELIGLHWSDLDLVRGKLHVRRTIWRGQVGLPKGGRHRIVDLPQSAIEALKGHRAQTLLKGEYVFCRTDGKPLSPGQLKSPLTRAIRRAGIAREEGRIGWHDLRHTYGSHLAMRGVPLKVIQELMGHATMEMTMRYAHLSPETKREAVQVLDAPARHMHGTWSVGTSNQP